LGHTLFDTLGSALLNTLSSTLFRALDSALFRTLDSDGINWCNFINFIDDCFAFASKHQFAMGTFTRTAGTFSRFFE
jgi:hypothetical protein